jgi:hypothetical protein
VPRKKADGHELTVYDLLDNSTGVRSALKCL